MKKNIAIATLLVTNVITVILLVRIAFVRKMWQEMASIHTTMAARLLAADNFSKGKLVRLRLKIEKEPKPGDSSYELDGDTVIQDWIGYHDPFPILGGHESPSVQTSRLMVEAFNERMQELRAHPDEYHEQRSREIEYWERNVLQHREGERASGLKSPSHANDDALER